MYKIIHLGSCIKPTMKKLLKQLSVLHLILIVLYANMSAPFIPDTSRKIHEAMGTKKLYYDKGMKDYWIEKSGSGRIDKSGF